MAIKKNTGREALEEFAQSKRDEDIQAQQPVGQDLENNAYSTGLLTDEEIAEQTPSPISTGEEGPGGSGITDYSQQAGIEEFKFLECDPLLPGEQPTVCPVCEPNPYAYVPDYRMMEHGEVFFDGKRCMQTIVILEDAPLPSLSGNFGGPTSIELNSEKYQNDVKERGIRLMLEYFNKTDTATVYYYKEKQSTMGSEMARNLAINLSGIASVLPPGGQAPPDPIPGYELVTEEVDVVAELLQYAEYTYHVPIQKKARTRVAISVSVEYLERIPTRAIVEPTTNFETDLEVTIDGRDFLPMFRRSIHALKHYSRQYDRWHTIEGGSLIEIETGAKEYLNLDHEASELKSFRKAVQKMVQDHKFKFGVGYNQIEKITFKFEEVNNSELSLKQIILNKPGCPDIVFSEDSDEYGTVSSFREVLSKTSASSRTLYYVGALPEMDMALQAREPMPWIEFVTKFTYPGLEVFYGPNSNSLFNDPTMASCFADSQFQTTEDLLNAALDIGMSLPDAILDKFATNTCKTREEMQIEMKEISSGPPVGQAVSDIATSFANAMADQYERARQEALNSVVPNDPWLDKVIEAFEEQNAAAKRIGTTRKKLNREFRSGDTEDVLRAGWLDDFAEWSYEKKIWKRINDKIGYCGWIAMTMSAVDCVAKGLGEDDAKAAMTAAALKGMNEVNLGRIFIGLPPEEQQKIMDVIEEEFGDVPAPWDAGYIEGSYSGPGFRSDAPTPVPASDAAEAVYDEMIEEGVWMEGDLASAQAAAEAGTAPVDSPDEEPSLNAATQVDATGTDARADAARLAIAQTPDLSDGFLGVSYTNGEFGTAPADPGSGGTWGQALSSVQKAIDEAYRDAMLELVGADILLNEMNKLPGAPFVAQYLKTLPCKPNSPLNFNPRLDSFMSTLEADFCNWDFSITLPQLNPPLGSRVKVQEAMRNLFRMITQAVWEAIKEAGIAMMMEGLKLVLDKVISLACDTLSTLGASLADLAAGNSHFKDMLKDNMCPDANDEDLYNTLKGLLDPITDRSCLETITNAEMGAFIDDVSLMLTQGQVLELLTGTASQDTLALSAELAATSESECIREIFSDPSAFETFFPALGNLIPNLEELEDALMPGTFDLPVHPCPPEILDRINDLRCELLQEKGLTPAECREQLDDLKDQALQDLNDLADLLQNGPFANMPPLTSTPGCTPDGFFPVSNPLVDDMNAKITAALYAQIEIEHLRDLMGPVNTVTGQAGVINCLLADTAGRPWKHHNWMVRNFGSPFASQNGFFEWTSDNAIRRPGDSPGNDKIPVDIYGQDLKGIEGRGASWFGYSEGGFPPTVGAWMHKQLSDVRPEFSTKITSTAGVSEYNEAWEENEQRISNRLAYVDAFIEEFNLEDHDPWPAEFAAVADELRQAVRKEGIFVSEEDLSKPKELTDYSPEERLWNVLNGKNISIKGILVGTKPPKKWNVNPLDGEYNSFVELYGNESVLVPLPDTSSADVRIHFQDYGDDPENPESSKPYYQFDLEYDYNLVDSRGNLRSENEYRLKIVEQVDSPKGGGKATRKQLKKQGGEVPPASILDEGPYRYTLYDIVSKSSPDEEVLNYLDGLGRSQNVSDAYEIEAFYTFFRENLIAASSQPIVAGLKMSSEDFRKHFADSFDIISGGFLQRIAGSIASGKADFSLSQIEEEEIDPGFLQPEELKKREEEQAAKIGLDFISPGFKFGYDPYSEPDIIYLDNETYGGTLGRLFPEQIPPPFYVQEKTHSGWMDIAQTLVPEVDGCDPARKQLFDLGALAQESSALGNQLLPDERLNTDPLCTEEAPYDKIFDSQTVGNIDGAMRASIRIYVMDVFIRAVPVFIMFGLTEENYDDLLLAFMAERIKQGLYQDGRPMTGRTDDEYYYRILEQCVNNVHRKVLAEILNPEEDFNLEEREAYNLISNRVVQFYDEYSGKMEALSSAAISSQHMMKRAMSPAAKKTTRASGLGAGSASFNKVQAKKAKKLAWEQTIRETEDLAVVFLKRYIREEFDKVRQDFAVKMPPAVDNIHYYFLLSDLWVRGGVYGNGPFNVQSDPNNPLDYGITTTPVSYQEVADQMRELAETTGISAYEATADLLESGFANAMDAWPFVLEKYIRIEEKEFPPASISRNENLYGVVNIDSWDTYVKNKKNEGLSGNISDYWGNPVDTGATTKIDDHTHTYYLEDGVTSTSLDSNGKEHFHVISNGNIERVNDHTHEIEVTGWKFGLRLSYMPAKDNNGTFKDIIETISSTTIMNEKAYKVNSPESERYLIPIASAELSIPDQEFTSFDPESYDVYCLIQELVKTVEYKTMFKYIFPLPRFTSIMAVYNIMGFFASLGNSGWPTEGGDMWMQPGGKRGSGFRKWVRGPQAFKKSRRAARNVFTSLYDSAQTIDFSSENRYDHKDSQTNLRDSIRPRVNFDDGLRWWQRGRRVTSRPYDLDGNECDD